MKVKDQGLVSRAAESLKLRDIALFSSRFERPVENIPPMLAADQQAMRQVTVAKGDIELEPETKKVVQIRVTLGARLAASKEDSDSESEVYYLIEATFLVEYEQISDVSDEALAAFANFNAVHNVWPFWRQHVFDIVSRGRLPQLEVPLFAGYKFEEQV